MDQSPATRKLPSRATRARTSKGAKVGKAGVTRTRAPAAGTSPAVPAASASPAVRNTVPTMAAESAGAGAGWRVKSTPRAVSPGAASTHSASRGVRASRKYILG